MSDMRVLKSTRRNIESYTGAIKKVEKSTLSAISFVQMSEFTEVTADNLRAVRDLKEHTQDQVAELLGLQKSNVSHIETGRRALSSSEKQILDWYFFGKVPPRILSASLDLQGVLEFSEMEWRLVTIMATRDGLQPGKWIASQIRTILAFRNAETASAAIPFPAPVKYPKDSTTSLQSVAESVVAFPEITLLPAAAGGPITGHPDTFAPTKNYGPGRIAVQLYGTSMEPTFGDRSVVIMREKESLRRPVLKKGEIYVFVINGENTVKIYDTRKATDDEIQSGIAHLGLDGKPKVRTLRSINPEFPEIVLKDTDEAQWIAWLDPADNR